jgi:hypothetical protein
MPSSGILCHVVLVRTDVLEQYIASIIISEVGKTLAVTISLIVFTPLEVIRFLQDPHGVTSEKTAFFSYSLRHTWSI